MNKHMRILALIMTGLLLLSVLAACSPKDPPPPEDENESSQAPDEQPPQLPLYPAVDTGDLAKLKEVYLSPLAASGRLRESWRDEKGIAPGSLKAGEIDSALLRATDAAQTEDVLTIWSEGLDSADQKTLLFRNEVTLRLVGEGFLYISNEFSPEDALTYTGVGDELLPMLSTEWIMAATIALGGLIWLLRRRIRAVVQRVF